MSFRNYFLICTAAILVISGCEPDLYDDPIPFVPFSTITINTSLPEYQQLRTQHWQYINSGGVRGILLYRENEQSYIAYERNCSFHPNEACATIEVDASNLYITDPCCGSNFDFLTGLPTSGVAWRPLRRYETSLSGTTLTITDTVLE